MTGECKCEAAWHGFECDFKYCPGFEESGADCTGNGVCASDGSCQCAAGWTGPACDTRVCLVDCGLRGRCSESGTCVCQQGWTGQNCRDPQCLNDCSGKGDCTFTAPNSPAECVCHAGWVGADCSMQALSAALRTCANECSANGLCMDGKCVCDVGFRG